MQSEVGHTSARLASVFHSEPTRWSCKTAAELNGVVPVAQSQLCRQPRSLFFLLPPLKPLLPSPSAVAKAMMVVMEISPIIVPIHRAAIHALLLTQV